MVKDSIIDIKAECIRMINDATSVTEGIELIQCVKLVRESLALVEQEYAKSERYDDIKIALLKNACECSAVRLEKCLAVEFSEYRDRYKLRCLINEVYDKVRRILRQLQINKDFENLEQVVAERAFVERCVQESKHVLLNLDKQEIACLWDLYNRY